MWCLYTSGVQRIAHPSTATPPVGGSRFGSWEMCHATSNDHTLPSTFSVSGNVHAPPITRQTPRPQHASRPRERGCPAINTTHHACTPLRYARTCECGSVHHRPCRTDHTLHSTPSHRPVRRAVTCTRRCWCNSDTQHSRGACPGSLGEWPNCGRGSQRVNAAWG